MRKSVISSKFRSFIARTASFDVLIVESILIISVFIVIFKFNGNFANTKLFAEGASFDASLTINWTRPTGFLSVAAQKKDVSWNPVTYIVSLKCTNTFLGCPADLGDKITTTSASGSTTVVNGFTYDYTVWILTKSDTDHNSVGRYVYETGSFTGSCGADSTCSKKISWSAVDYDVHLVDDNGSSVCGSTAGCSDYTKMTGTSATFRGLPQDVNLNKKIETNGHFLEQGAVGKSETQTFSCSDTTATPNTCTIKNAAGIGPFLGSEPLVYSVRANNVNGPVLEGAFFLSAASNGSLTHSWNWKYAPVVFPTISPGGVCGVNCKTADVASNNQNLTYTFNGLANGIVYQELVCVNACSSTSQYIVNTTATASNAQQAALYKVKSTLNSDPAPKNGVVDFSWLPARGTFASQALEFSYSRDFAAGTVQSASIADSQVSMHLTGFAQNSTYYWRIKSNTAGGGSTASLTRSFVINTPPPQPPITGGDSDGDGFRDTVEQYIGTDPFKKCGSGAFPPDVNNDGAVNSIDLGLAADHFGLLGSKTYNKRYDMNADKVINSIDLALISRAYGACSATLGVSTSSIDATSSNNVLGCTAGAPCVSGVVQGCGAQGLQFLYVWSSQPPYNKQYLDISDDALKLANGSYYSVDVTSANGQYPMYGMVQNTTYAWRVRILTGVTNQPAVSQIDTFKSMTCNIGKAAVGAPACSDGPYGAYLKWNGYATYIDISTDNFATYSNKAVAGLNLTSTYDFSGNLTLSPGVTYKWRLWSGKPDVYVYGPDIYVPTCNSGVNAKGDQVRAYTHSLVHDMNLPMTDNLQHYVGQSFDAGAIAFGIAGCETGGQFTDGSDIYYGIWQFDDTTYVSNANGAISNPIYKPYVSLPINKLDANDDFKAAPVVLYMIETGGADQAWKLCTDHIRSADESNREWTDWQAVY